MCVSAGSLTSGTSLIGPLRHQRTSTSQKNRVWWRSLRPSSGPGITWALDPAGLFDSSSDGWVACLGMALDGKAILDTGRICSVGGVPLWGLGSDMSLDMHTSRVLKTCIMWHCSNTRSSSASVTCRTGARRLDRPRVTAPQTAFRPATSSMTTLKISGQVEN